MLLFTYRHFPLENLANYSSVLNTTSERRQNVKMTSTQRVSYGWDEEKNAFFVRVVWHIKGFKISYNYWKHIAAPGNNFK